MTVAHIVARGEAAVAVSALAAAGVPTYVGAYAHLSIVPLTVPLGGYRIMVPAAAYQDASDILRPMPGDTPAEILKAFRRRVWRLIFAWLGAVMAMSIATAAIVGSLMIVLHGAVAGLFLIFGFHVPPPPWRGDYYLAIPRSE